MENSASTLNDEAEKKENDNKEIMIKMKSILVI